MGCTVLVLDWCWHNAIKNVNSDNVKTGGKLEPTSWDESNPKDSFIEPAAAHKYGIPYKHRISYKKRS